jgi:hypothetical protein
MTRWSAITRTPPQLLRARLRLALHSRGGKLNPVVHHERGRYSGFRDPVKGASRGRTVSASAYDTTIKLE